MVKVMYLKIKKISDDEYLKPNLTALENRLRVAVHKCIHESQDALITIDDELYIGVTPYDELDYKASLALNNNVLLDVSGTYASNDGMWFTDESTFYLDCLSEDELTTIVDKVETLVTTLYENSRQNEPKTGKSCMNDIDF